MKFYLFFISFCFTVSFQAQTTFKTMFYNLLNYPTAPPANRNTILKDILNTYEPDIFMVCELESEQASNDILNFSLSEINKNYLSTTFVSNRSSTSEYSNLQQEIFYNSDYFTLENQEEIQTNIRDINHYTLQLKNNNQNTNPIYLEIFVTHLKASQSTYNQQQRLDMVTQFTNALNNLDPDSYVIFAGDFNFYTSSESGYQKILDNNNHVLMKDVLNLNNNTQSWHTNYNYRAIHTQATRLSNSNFSGYGAGGGLDDRFDFITFSENILETSDINYIQNSYKSYGNNGNCYNKRIDDNSCAGNYDFTLRSNLYLMSDHLPVIASIQSAMTLGTKNISWNASKIKLLNGNLIKDSIALKVSEDLVHHRFTLYNNLGQIVVDKKITQSQVSINTLDLAKGIYFIKVAGYTKIIKFVKI